MGVVVTSGFWSYKTCKAPVKSSPPTNQHPAVFTGWMPFLSSSEQCQSTEGKWGENGNDNTKMKDTVTTDVCMCLLLAMFQVYDGLSYKLVLEFPSGYPYKAPTVKFETPCYHPNVDGSGNICLDILKEKWSALYDVRTILLSIQSLLGGAYHCIWFLICLERMLWVLAPYSCTTFTAASTANALCTGNISVPDS